MCGIIGYTGSKYNAKDVIITGLKNLEYRGYDSAGIAVAQSDKINLYKSKGKISNLEDKIKDLNIVSNTGIGHTRWATHGEPSETNAHPHKSGSVTLVHNGIIENYNELKFNLLELGVNFKSETDTFIIPGNANWLTSLGKSRSCTTKFSRIRRP